MVLRTVIKSLRRKEHEARILLFGLDNAGKTTLLRRICYLDVNDVAPTFGFEIRTQIIDGMKLHIWDIGGQKSLRPYWRNYFEKTDGIVYVVDSTDIERLRESKEVLHEILKDGELFGAVVVIMANKQDTKGAVDINEIRKILDVEAITGHRFFFANTSALTGQGVQDGFNVIVEDLRSRLFV